MVLLNEKFLGKNQYQVEWNKELVKEINSNEAQNAK